MGCSASHALARTAWLALACGRRRRKDGCLLTAALTEAQLDSLSRLSKLFGPQQALLALAHSEWRHELAMEQLLKGSVYVVSRTSATQLAIEDHPVAGGQLPLMAGPLTAPVGGQARRGRKAPAAYLVLCAPRPLQAGLHQCTWAGLEQRFGVAKGQLAGRMGHYGVLLRGVESVEQAKEMWSRYWTVPMPRYTH